MGLLNVLEDLARDVDALLEDPATFSGRDVILTPNPGVRVAFAEEIERE